MPQVTPCGRKLCMDGRRGPAALMAGDPGAAVGTPPATNRLSAAGEPVEPGAPQSTATPRSGRHALGRGELGRNITSVKPHILTTDLAFTEIPDMQHSEMDGLPTTFDSHK